MSEHMDNTHEDSDNKDIIKYEDWDSMNLKDILRGIYTNGLKSPVIFRVNLYL